MFRLIALDPKFQSGGMGRLPDLENEALVEPRSQKPLQAPGRNVQLTIYREIVGIDPAPALGHGDAKRSAQNKGLYKRTCQAESKARYQYYICAATFNTCFLLQIVVAAALTAIGAANGPHMAVTVLGAVNTVIAGMLTYLKGQGLPNRLRRYQSELRKVREYIEERERDFSRADCQLDLDNEIAIIYRMYEAVRQNNEDNFPDNYHNFVGVGATKPAGTSEAKAPSGKQVDAIPDDTASANVPQVEVTATEVPSGISDRSSNRNSLHVPNDAHIPPIPKSQDIYGGLSVLGQSGGRNGRPSSLDIDPTATGIHAAPYAGLQHLEDRKPRERPTSSLGRSPNSHDRQTSTGRPHASRERPTSMHGRRISAGAPAGTRDKPSHSNSVHESVERPPAPSEGPLDENRLYEDPINRVMVPGASGRSSNRDSTYIPAQRPESLSEDIPTVHNEHTYTERPTTPILSGRSYSRRNSYTSPEQLPHAEIRNIPPEMARAPSDGLPNSTPGLPSLGRGNSTTPVKQFLNAAQRRS